MGFAEDRETLRCLSNKQRNAWLERLSAACVNYISGELLAQLRDAFKRILGNPGAGSWELESDPEDAEAIRFVYPSSGLATGIDYIAPEVRIELGARSEHQPSSAKQIRPYAAIQFQSEFAEPACLVKALDAERTFWEKATILHACHHGDNPEKAHRASRHYYDVCMLSRSNVKSRALANLELLADVADHKDLFYRAAWARYDEAKAGSLRLVPKSTLEAALSADYRDMREMFFDEPPSFEDMMTELDSLESEINGP